jgi:hypothetical protein
MGLNMRGHVSGPFVTHKDVVLRRYTSEIVDFDPKIDLVYTDTFDANVQPVGDTEIEFFQIGAERLNDYRVIHRNDGKGILVVGDNKLADIVIFAPTPDESITWWKCVATDYRPWHGFCRSVIARLDPAEIEKLQGYANG